MTKILNEICTTWLFECYITRIYTYLNFRMKHLTQTLENMDNQNRTRLDAIENTNHTMLKAICNFVRQDQHESTKDAMDDVAMSGTQNTCVNDQRLPCENPKKPVSTPTLRSMKNEAFD